jgi:hypothetical protein
VHERNLGYGANQKTCYSEAVSRGAEIVVMLHPASLRPPVANPEARERILL